VQLGLNKQLQPHEIKSYKHKIKNQTSKKQKAVCQTGLVLRPTVSDHITGIWCTDLVIDRVFEHSVQFILNMLTCLWIFTAQSAWRNHSRKPDLSYNLVTANLPKSERSTVDYGCVWIAIVYKIFGLLGEPLQFVYAYTRKIPVSADLIVKQLSFLRNCVRTENKVLLYSCFDDKDLLQCSSWLHCGFRYGPIVFSCC